MSPMKTISHNVKENYALTWKSFVAKLLNCWDASDLFDVLVVNKPLHLKQKEKKNNCINRFAKCHLPKLSDWSARKAKVKCMHVVLALRTLRAHPPRCRPKVNPEDAATKVACPEISCKFLCLPRHFAATSTSKVIFTIVAALLARFPRETLLLDIIYGGFREKNNAESRAGILDQLFADDVPFVTRATVFGVISMQSETLSSSQLWRNVYVKWNQKSDTGPNRGRDKINVASSRNARLASKIKRQI